MFVRLFLALLLRRLGLRPISTASSTLHLGMFAGGHLSVSRFHLILLMLAAHSHHLLLVMLRIHLLLMTHLLIHGILAVTGAAMFDSLVVLPGLVCSDVLIVAMKIFSLVFISGGLVLTFFTMFFAAHSGSRTRTFLMLRHGPPFVSGSSSCCSSCGADFVFAFALANAFVFVERLDRVLVRFALVRRSEEIFVFGCRLLTFKLL